MMFLLFLLTLFATQQPSPADSGIISGQIRDVHGAPIAGIRVAAMAIETNAAGNPKSVKLSRLRETDSEGRYRLDNVPAGRYFIIAGLPDALTYYPGVRTQEESRTVSVATRQSISNLDFALIPPLSVTIRGRVDIPFTLPVDVSITRADGADSATLAVFPNGNFEFPGVPPSVYDLRANPSIAPGVRVDASGGDVDDIVLVQAPFAGRVTMDDGSPLPAISIGADSTLIEVTSESKTVQQTRTVRQRTGKFEFMDARPGEYRIAVTQLPFGYFIKSMTFGDVDLTKNPLVVENVISGAGKEVSVSDFTKEIRVVLTKAPPSGISPGVRIVGRAIGFANTPVKLTLKSKSQDTVRVANTTTGSDGSFELEAIPPGRYTLTPSDVRNPRVFTIDVAGADVTNIEITP